MGWIEAAREELIATHKELEGISVKDTLTDEERSRAKELVGKMDELEARLNDGDAVANRVAKFRTDAGTQQRASGRAEHDDRGNPIEGEPEREERKKDTRHWAQRVAESEEFAEYRANPKGQSAPVPVKSFFRLTEEQRAVIYSGALAADQVRPQLVPGVFRGNEALGLLAMRDVLLGGTTTQDAITFVQENVFTNNAAAVAEATSSSTGLKPESSLTFTQATAPVQTIAHWIPITRQALDDTAQLRTYVEGRLIDGLKRVESDQIINGDGSAPNISGILDQTGLQVLDATYFSGAPVNGTGTGAENYNRLLRAKTQIMLTGDALATFIAMNPSDWESMVTQLDGNDNFYGFGPFGNSDQPRLWNLPVVLTENLAVGQSIVGDGTAAAVWDRMAAQVLIADQHSDFFVRNLFVLLAEERLALTVYRPVAFADVTLA
jgi:HK97 family phage major capsid protein